MGLFIKYLKEKKKDERPTSEISIENEIRGVIKQTIDAIIADEIELAKERLVQRLKEKAASIAIQLSRHFQVYTDQHRIVLEFIDRTSAKKQKGDIVSHK